MMLHITSLTYSVLKKNIKDGDKKTFSLSMNDEREKKERE
jgi:hypothetical protein